MSKRPCFKALKKAYPALAPATALDVQPLPEIGTQAQLQETVRQIAAAEIFGAVIRAGGVTTEDGGTYSTHQELTIAAADILQANGQDYVLDNSSRTVAPRHAPIGPGILHFDGRYGPQKRINLHRTLQGEGDVMIGVGQPALRKLLRLPRDVLTAGMVSDALSEAVSNGQTLPDLMHPQVYAAELQPGDTVIFPEHPLDAPEGVVWHRFGTTVTPRAAAAVWLAPATAASTAYRDIHDAEHWRQLETPPSW